MTESQYNNNNHKKDVEIMRKWLEKQPHLPPDMDDQLLRRFLYSCNYSLERTKKTIDSFYTIRSTTPELFANRDPFDKRIQEVFRITDQIPLPTLTPEKYRVFLQRISSPNSYDTYDFVDATKTFLMIADVRLKEEKEFPAGEVPIMDAANTSLKYLTKVVFPVMKKYMIYVQEGHPVKLQQIHVINCPPFIDKIFAVVKPLCSKEVIDMVHFHLPNSDTLYKFIPQQILPSEYGGEAGTIAEIKKVWKEQLEGNRAFFLNDRQWQVNESKRPLESKENNKEILNMQGSFRTLSID